MSSKVKVAVRVRPFNRRGMFALLLIENLAIILPLTSWSGFPSVFFFLNRNWIGYQMRRRNGWHSNDFIFHCRLRRQVRKLSWLKNVFATRFYLYLYILEVITNGFMYFFCDLSGALSYYNQTKTANGCFDFFKVFSSTLVLIVLKPVPLY